MNRKDAINNLVKAAQERHYGDVLSIDEISSIIDHEYGTSAYNDILQTARKRLVAAGHMIVNVRGVGYKVCEPDSYTDEGIRKMHHGMKQVDRGSKIITHAPVNDMSAVAREAHNRVNDRMLRLQAAMAGASVEIHMLGKNTNPLLAAK